MESQRRVAICMSGYEHHVSTNWGVLKVLKLKTYLKPFLNIKFFISFGIAWMITNGWCYIGAVIGQIFHLKILRNISVAYMSFLYLPFTPEKLITIPIAMFLHRSLFKNDPKTKEQLLNMQQQAKNDWESIKTKFKGEKKNARRKLIKRPNSRYHKRH